MNQLSIPQELIESTRQLLKTGKELLVRVAYNLQEIRDEGSWKKEYETFPKFCQDVFELPQSATSKYLSIAEHFAEKFSPEEIGPVDIEKLYAASKLEGSPEENLSKAKTWSRDDFKANKALVQPHEFERVSYCKVCGISEERHA